MSDKKYKKEDCITLLKNKYQALLSQGQSRYPKRSDFEEREIVAIKAFLGPWPRALEAAGIKPPRAFNRQQHNKDKRRRSKQLQTALKKQSTEQKEDI